jgi:hypothetical protein
MNIAVAEPKNTLSTLTLHSVSHAHKATHLSTGAIAAVAIAAILVVCCLAWGIVRMTAFDPRWMQSLRHALAEASYRSSATLAEFGDWIRLGR